MAYSPAAIIGSAGGVAFVLAALLVVLARPARKGIHAFAGYAVLVGLQLLLGYAGQSLAMRGLLAFSYALMGMSSVAILVAVAAYTGRSERALLAGALGVQAMAAFILVVSPSSLVDIEGGPTNLGVVVWQMPPFLAIAWSALALLRARERVSNNELRIENLILLLALLPHLGYTAAVSMLVALTTPGALGQVWGMAYAATFSVCLAVVAYGVVRLAVEPSRPARLFAMGIAVATLAGFVQFLLLRNFVLFGGSLRVFAALAFAYGLLKYGLFDVDERIRWALSRATVLGMFGAVFFAVEQVAEIYVSDSYGTLAGVTAAAALLFALKPLHRWSARIADRLVPGIGTPGDGLDRREIIYRTAAAAAARDGVITPRERHMLDALRGALGLSDVDGNRIEEESFARG